MVAPLVVAAMAALGAAGGGAAGNKKAGAAKDAERFLDGQMGEWDALNLPELSPIELERYKNLFTPQLQGDSELAGIQIDPALRDAQVAALSQLGELSQGGLNLQDKADLANIQGEVARQDAARQGAIMQGMAERGMGGAGMELAQRLSSQQGGADRAAADARNVAAQAQSRALQAIMQRGQLGGAMRQQDYGQASDAARAQDAINQFNSLQKTRGEEHKQKIGMANTDQENWERGQAGDIAQQQYNNAVNKLSGKSGLAGARAGVTQDKGQAEADMISGITQGAVKGLGSMGGG